MREVGTALRRDVKSALDRRAFGPDVRPGKLDEIVDKDWPCTWNTRRERRHMVIKSSPHVAGVCDDAITL